MLHVVTAPFSAPHVCKPHVMQVVDHYDNPRNVGKMDKNDPNVGTGLVGAPACGDVMKLQIKVLLPPQTRCREQSTKPCIVPLHLNLSELSERCLGCFGVQWCRREHRCTVCVVQRTTDRMGLMHTVLQVDDDGNVTDAKFKTFGCGSAIASSSVATEWVKGKNVNEALTIKNSDIAKHLSLPPVKLHCSMLAEDAIKAAVKDIQERRAAAAAEAAGKK